MIERRRLRTTYLAIAGATFLGFTAAYIAVPAARPHLILEDDFLESLEALTFGAAALVGVVTCVRRKASRFHLLIPFCALLAMLDELSWGDRWLKYPLPTLRNLPIDGVHDAFLVTYDVFETHKGKVLVAYALAAVLGLAVLAWALRPGGWLRVKLRALFQHEPARYFAVAVVLIVISEILDLDLIENDALVFLEELFEFQAALALLFAGLAIG